MFVEVPKGREIAIMKRAFLLAYNAAYRVMDSSTPQELDEETLWGSVYNENDSKPALPLGVSESAQEKKERILDDLAGRGLFMDFCNGRQVKLHLSWRSTGKIGHPDGPADEKHQTWVNKFKTYKDLLAAAPESLAVEIARAEQAARVEAAQSVVSKPPTK